MNLKLIKKINDGLRLHKLVNLRQGTFWHFELQSHFYDFYEEKASK